MFGSKRKKNKKKKELLEVVDEVRNISNNQMENNTNENIQVSGNGAGGSQPPTSRAETAELGVAEASDDESIASSSSEPVFCNKCKLHLTDNIIQCDFCLEWYHMETECSNIDDQYAVLINNRNIKYMCMECCNDDGKPATMSPGKKLIRNTLDQLQSRLDTLFHMVEGIVSGTRSITNEMDAVKKQLKEVHEGENKNAQEMKMISYADKLKTTNVLVIKSNEEDGKAFEKKKSIMSNLKTPVERTRPTKEGHLILNFADKQQLENAKKEIDENTEENISVRIKGKLKPKVKICNISKDIENVRENILSKNPWIGELIENEEDFKMITNLKAKDEEKKHCIFKCSPLIRRALLAHDDKVYTLYESCNVYDSYSPYQCYKCQAFGHSAESCKENQVCGKCGGCHKLSECKVAKKSCINCIRKNHTNTEHATFETTCPVLTEERTRIKNNTDHGVEL